jgi:hypothetical protein
VTYCIALGVGWLAWIAVGAWTLRQARRWEEEGDE